MLPSGIIPLTDVSSDFPVCPAIVSALKDHIHQGYFSYRPNKGLVRFRHTFLCSLNWQRQRRWYHPLMLFHIKVSHPIFMFYSTLEFSPHLSKQALSPLQHFLFNRDISIPYAPFAFLVVLTVRIIGSGIVSFITPFSPLTTILIGPNSW